jgi:hypothetical protein
MAERKKAYVQVRSQIAKSANEIESDIWRLRAAMGLSPSEKERAFVEFCKRSPEVRRMLEEVKFASGSERARYLPDYLD